MNLTSVIVSGLLTVSAFSSMAGEAWIGHINGAELRDLPEISSEVVGHLPFNTAVREDGMEIERESGCTWLHVRTED
ncbi:MAG: hypothetical protein GF388_11285, partial [Candidatus Aegiribacteria sp.]|nr:hypothetical protein [Candidatus Aegiribacteria sp.]MBD3295578.1 hypothetical protein [Candidatus Fermentibacteria bacterium]